MGDWVHAHEEDTPGTMVFRPSSHPLPPSRGRRRLKLQLGGVLGGTSPGPDDRTQGSAGRWELHGDALRLDTGTAPQELHVLSATTDRLVLKKA